MEEIYGEVELVQEVRHGDSDLGEKAGQAGDRQQGILEGLQRSTNEPGAERDEDQGQQSADVGEGKTDWQGDVDRPLDLLTSHVVVPVELFEILDQEWQDNEVIIGGKGR